MKPEILNESTQTADLALFSELEDHIFERIYSESLISQVTSVQTMKSPTAYVYSFSTTHKPKDVDDADVYDLTFIVCDNTHGMVIGSMFTIPGGTGVVKYIEKNSVLVKTSKDISVGTIITFNAHSIKVLKLSKNRSSIIYAFSKFFDSTENTLPNEINLTVNKILTTAVTKKIRTAITREVFDDIKVIYKDNFKEKLIKNISQIIIDEIDREAIELLNDVATILEPATISTDLSNTGFGDFPSYLFSKLSEDIVNLHAQINRGLTFQVILSPKVAGILLSSIQSSVSDNTQRITKNEKYIGTISAYDCFIDSFASEDYYMIAYNSENFGDATLVVGKYKDSLNWVVDPDTGNEALIYLNRKSICRNPQDTGTALNDSIFACKRILTFA